ncbi:MAG TPA: MerR family transcriptional regulator [Acidimicrobiia bacterium]|nr:MerR family transcriptional regulator [Acidimicrobiia bacterium]
MSLGKSNMINEQHYQIGEVAEKVGLSLRTIRYYEEVGLVIPSGRSDGGFRLYTDPDIERLRLIKALKPIGMSLEAMAELLEVRDQLADPGREDKAEIGARLDQLLEQGRQACNQLDARVDAARQALAGLETAGGPVGQSRR